MCLRGLGPTSVSVDPVDQRPREAHVRMGHRPVSHHNQTDSRMHTTPQDPTFAGIGRRVGRPDLAPTPSAREQDVSTRVRENTQTNVRKTQTTVQ